MDLAGTFQSETTVMDSMVMYSCDICKEKSTSVELRQSDDLRCDKCTDTQKCRNSHDGEAEIRELCSMYPRLVENIKMKDRSSKGKQKLGFTWHGSLEQQKDFRKKEKIVIYFVQNCQPQHYILQGNKNPTTAR